MQDDERQADGGLADRVDLRTDHDLVVEVQRAPEVGFRAPSGERVEERGRVLAEGAPDEVRSNPAVREVYLGVEA